MEISTDALRIGQSDTHLPADDTPYRAAFAAQRALVLPGALAPDLLTRLRALSRQSAFVSNPLAGLGHREIERPRLTATAVDLMLTRQILFRWLEQVTGCAPITRAGGDVARTHAAPDDRLDWHDDLNAPESAMRRLAITIALDDLAYSGGLFELRRVGSTAPLLAYKHERAGTAVIFEVSPELEHRVRPLTGGGPRLVYAGWFTG